VLRNKEGRVKKSRGSKGTHHPTQTKPYYDFIPLLPCS